MWKRDLYIIGGRVDPVTNQEALGYIAEMVEKPIWEDQTQHYIVTVNPEIILHTIKDDQYRILLNKSGLSVADGFGLNLAARILDEKIPERITGVDLMVDVCAMAVQKQWPVFLLGGRDSAKEAAEKLKSKFPGLKIVGTDPGLEIKVIGREINYSADENQKLLEKINQSGAKILFVAFGAPKQEKWIVKNLGAMPAIKLSLGVGGAFDYLSGKVRRAPKIFRKAGLEWLFRLVTQPWRLPRIFNATLKFIFIVIMCRIRIATTFRPNVVGLILNQKKQVLVVTPERLKYTAWQFPQGGVDKGEPEEKAIMREMDEELGTDKLEVLKKIPNIHSYVWPKWAQRAQCYKGQKQTMFILKFTGQDSDFNFEKDKELKSFRWVDQNQLLNVVDKFRKPLAEKALNELKEVKLW